MDMQIFCENFKTKKIFLIFLLGPIPIFIPDLPFTKTLFYITPAIILFTISLLLNFPGIIHFLHGKATTIEDLKDINSTDPTIKNKFIILFEWSLTFMLAFLIGILVDYYINKTEMTHLSSVEMVGIIGGLISVIYRCESVLGKFLLFILKMKKETIPKKPSLEIEIEGFGTLQLPSERIPSEESSIQIL